MTPSTQEALADYIDPGRLRGCISMLTRKRRWNAPNRGGGRPMLNGDANARWKKLFKERDPVFRNVANVHVHTRGLTRREQPRR